jgi:Zn finger protein HypA/HybF involved in hydrogenase expression
MESYQRDDGHRTVEWGPLSAQELICLPVLKEQTRLRAAAWEIELAPDFPTCRDCVRLLPERRREIRDTFQHSCDILHITRSYIEKPNYGNGNRCDVCYSRVRRGLDSFRQDLWTNLRLSNSFCL